MKKFTIKGFMMSRLMRSLGIARRTRLRTTNAKFSTLTLDPDMHDLAKQAAQQTTVQNTAGEGKVQQVQVPEQTMLKLSQLMPTKTPAAIKNLLLIGFNGDVDQCMQYAKEWASCANNPVSLAEAQAALYSYVEQAGEMNKEQAGNSDSATAETDFVESRNGCNL